MLHNKNIKRHFVDKEVMNVKKKRKNKKPLTTSDKIALVGICIMVALWLIDKALMFIL